MRSDFRAEGQNGAFWGQTAPRGRGAVPLIGECLCTAPLPRGGGSPARDIKQPIRTGRDNHASPFAPEVTPPPKGIFSGGKTRRGLDASSQNARTIFVFTLSRKAFVTPAIRHRRTGALSRAAFISDHAARYGVTARTVKRWREIGRIAGDEIDLTSPAAVLEWWGRNMSQRPTHGILQAAVAAGLSDTVADLIPRNLRELPDEPTLFEQAAWAATIAVPPP